MTRRKWQGWYWWMVILTGCLLVGAPAFAAPITVTDDAGTVIQLEGVPRQVVCLVPSATEMIFAMGAGDAVAGITHHSSGLLGAAATTLVGGFFAPSAERIRQLAPDLIVASPLQLERIATLHGSAPILVLETRRMDDAFRHLKLLGTLFGRPDEAAALIAKNRRKLDLIARKVAAIPAERRRRVMRLMGQGAIMTPGNDSFQNEMIRAAGGIAPDFDQAGGIISVSQRNSPILNTRFFPARWSIAGRWPSTCRSSKPPWWLPASFTISPTRA